jgi:hypothetical protein
VNTPKGLTWKVGHSAGLPYVANQSAKYSAGSAISANLVVFLDYKTF